MNEDFIDVYGGYAMKLIRLQTDLIQTLDRHRRGNRQTVEVHHVHIYPGGQGVVGIANSPQGEGKDQEFVNEPMHRRRNEAPVSLRHAPRCGARTRAGNIASRLR